MEILNDAARRLQAHIPVVLSDPGLDKIYKEHSEYLNPVYPCGVDSVDALAMIIEWAQQNHDFVTGQCSVAMVSPHPVLTDFVLAVMAQVFMEKGSSLGRYVRTQLTFQSLLDVANKAPGTVVIPADRLTIGSNLYNIGSEVRAMFSSTKRYGKGGFFYRDI